MDMHRNGCSGECDHTRGCLMYVVPLRTPSTVHKKNPVRRMRGEPEPTRASIGHGGSTRDLPQRTPGQSEGSEPSRPESSDPMREAGEPSTSSLATHQGVVLCPAHRG